MRLFNVWEYKKASLLNHFLSQAHKGLRAGDKLVVEHRDSVWRVELWVPADS